MSSPQQTLRRELWRPDEHAIWVRRQPRLGWGWTINFAEIARRFGRR
ncbi:MAG TPA: hypothetical protein VF533_22730 [Solirubrobacteraceae bacterium]|jgi:hypothetical protein